MRCFVQILLASIMALSARGQAPQELARSSAACESLQPGVHYEISKVAWSGSNRLTIAVKVVVDNAKGTVFIGTPAEKALPAQPTPEDLIAECYQPKPYSLTAATLVNEKTGVQYKAFSDLKGNLFLGPVAIITTLSAGQWVQLSVQFDVSAKEIMGDEEPRTKLTLYLPNARRPITQIPVPAH